MRMKPVSIALVTSLMLLVPASASTVATVTLEIDIMNLDYRSCTVQVHAGSNAGDVLDAAVAAGCIDSWEYSEFAGFGRYVTCIDIVCEAGVTYWAFWYNSAFSSVGIDGVRVADGDTVRFNYAEWVTGL